jgi:hypothetical protein
MDLLKYAQAGAERVFVRVGTPLLPAIDKREQTTASSSAALLPAAKCR